MFAVHLPLLLRRTYCVVNQNSALAGTSVRETQSDLSTAIMVGCACTQVTCATQVWQIVGPISLEFRESEFLELSLTHMIYDLMRSTKYSIRIVKLINRIEIQKPKR